MSERIGRCADCELHAWLDPWFIELGHDITLEPAPPHVAHDADHRHPPTCGVVRATFESLSDGILLRPERLRHRLVDDGHPAAILLSEVASCSQRHAHRL